MKYRSNYQIPRIKMMNMQAGPMLADSMTKADGNSGIEYGGGGDEYPRARTHNVWDDGEE